MQIYKCFFFLLVFLTQSSFGTEISDVDFDHSNGLDLMKKYSAKYLDSNADAELELLKKNYKNLKPSQAAYSPSPIIPKIIHQIWLGDNDIPKNFQYYLETWRKYHPNWQIKIWTKEDLIKENFSSMDLFHHARSYAEQSDLMRYELLLRYGGLYIDTDIECFKSFEEFHHKYDFYANMEPPALNKKRVTIANNMIASVPNHYILKQTLNYIRTNWNKTEENFEENFSNSWTKFARSAHNLAVLRTMYPLSDAVFNFFQTQDQSKYKSIILPSSYNLSMYVVNNTPIINFLSNSFRGRAKLSNKIEVQPETMSFHFYDKQNSLMKKLDFATAVFNKNKIKGFFYKLLKFRDKYYLAFRDLYKANHPVDVEYNPQTIIPKVIYLYSENLSQIEQDSLKQQWQKMNDGFNIQTIDLNMLKLLLPQKLKSLNSEVIHKVAAFYLLYQNGGAFVEPSFKPAKLSEFHYKYGFYGILNSLNKVFSPLALNTNILAFRPNHSLLYNVINDLENKDFKKTALSKDILEDIYLENAYKYYHLDGKSIILTEESFNQKR
ncbi:MAG: glycosyltransferase [Rickettsiales bacterium]